MHILRANIDRLILRVVRSISSKELKFPMVVRLMRDRRSGVEHRVWILRCCVAAISDILHQLTLLAADGHCRHVGAAKRRHAGARRAGSKANATQTSRQSGDGIAGEAAATVFSASLLIGAKVADQDDWTGHMMQ